MTDSDLCSIGSTLRTISELGALTPEAVESYEERYRAWLAITDEELREWWPNWEVEQPKTAPVHTEIFGVLTPIQELWDRVFGDGPHSDFKRVYRNKIQDWNTTSYDGSNQPQYTVMTKSAFDAMGRVVSSTDALSHTTTTAYTPAAGATEPGSLTSAVVTNTTAPVTWKTSTTYQPTWNVPVEVSDQNAKITDLTYDPLGRRTAVWLPGNSKTANPADPNSAYSYTLSQTVPSFVTTTTLKATSKVTTYSLYDGLGQLIQSQAPNVAGKTTVTDYGYDTQGNQTLVDNPYWTADVTPSGTLFVPNNVSNIPSATATQYDPVGRPTAQLTLSYGAEKFRTTTSYPGSDRTDVTPPAGGTPTSTYSNSLSQRTSLVQYQASSISGAAPTITTTYGYDTLGKLATMRDQDGNTWTWNYDLLGNQTSATDPDTGTTTTVYDAGGNLLTSTDSRGVTLAYTYDTLNRKTAVYAGSTAGAIQSKWTYDGVAGAVGQVSSASTYAGSTPSAPGAAYTTSYTGYDSGYQPTGQTVSIPASAPAFGGTHYSFTVHNRDETLKIRVIPAMGGLGIEGLRYGYDSLGNLSSLSGTNTYGIINYTNIGQVGSITRGRELLGVNEDGADVFDVAARREGVERVVVGGEGACSEVGEDVDHTRVSHPGNDALGPDGCHQ